MSISGRRRAAGTAAGSAAAIAALVTGVALWPHGTPVRNSTAPNPSSRTVASTPATLGTPAASGAPASLPLGTETSANSVSPGVSTGPSTMLGPIPWIDAPADDSPAPVTLPYCRADQLSASVGDLYQSPGKIIVTVALRNTSGVACALPSDSATVTDGRGHELPGGDPAGGGDLPPGSNATVLIAAMGCSGSMSAASGPLRLQLPGDGGALPLPATPRMPAMCNPTVGGYVTPAMSRLYDLTVSVPDPGPATPGTTNHFTVVLSNPTGSDVPLDPCPDYILSNGDDPVRQLNCAAVPGHAIPAGGSVAFDMVADVPLSSAGQGIQLYWILAVPAGAPKHPAATIRMQVQLASHAAPSGPGPASPPGKASGCRVADLEPGDVQSGPAMGTIYTQFSLINRGATPCVLSGFPVALQGELAGGSLAAIRFTTYDGAGPGEVSPAVIPPGGVGLLDLTSPEQCANPSPSFTAIIVVLNDGKLRIPLPAAADPLGLPSWGCVSVDPMGGIDDAGATASP